METINNSINIKIRKYPNNTPSCAGKLIKILTTARLNHHIENKQLLDTTQNGVRKRRGTKENIINRNIHGI